MHDSHYVRCVRHDSTEYYYYYKYLFWVCEQFGPDPNISTKMAKSKKDLSFFQRVVAFFKWLWLQYQVVSCTYMMEDWEAAIYSILSNLFTFVYHVNRLECCNLTFGWPFGSVCVFGNLCGHVCPVVVRFAQVCFCSLINIFKFHSCWILRI